MGRGKKRRRYDEELSPEVIAVLREVAPEKLEHYDELPEHTREFLRTETPEGIRSLYQQVKKDIETWERTGDIPLPDWNPDPDSPMITRLWEIAKRAEADNRPIEEIERFVEEYNREAAEQGKLLTDDVWEGITGPWIFIPASGLGESEGEEEDDDEERGADAE